MLDCSPAVLFISRGFGLGHSTRDIQIARALFECIPNQHQIFASYAEGLTVFDREGIPVIDLGIPSLGNDSERVPKLGRLLMEKQPHLVVADEELYTLPLCEMLGIPVVFVTNWIVGTNLDTRIVFLKNANHIVMADLEDSFLIPQWLNRPVSFVGPICRNFSFSMVDKVNARTQLGVSPGQKLVIITASGTYYSDVFFFRMCAEALARMDSSVYAVIAVGDLYQAYEFFHYGFAPNIRFIDRLPDLPCCYAASDLVITRGGHTTLWELALLNTPTICVPHSPEDDPLHERYAITMQRRGTIDIIWEGQLNTDYVYSKVSALLCDQARLQNMKERCQKVATYKGAKEAARIIHSHIPN